MILFSQEVTVVPVSLDLRVMEQEDVRILTSVWMPVSALVITDTALTQHQGIHVPVSLVI